jgi:type I restriction enzyme S subunit
MPVMIPPKNLVEKYTEFTTPIFESIQSFLSQNQNLRQTRDLLLPRLISGELSVENLEVKI